jgi:homoserine kinase type II
MAVYTHVPAEEMDRFLARYGVGRLVSAKGIAEGVENSNYLLLTDRAPFILTLYEKRVRPEDLPFFLGLMEHLAKAGVPCPTPLHGKDGAALRELKGRPAAIISFLNGVSPRRVRPEQCAELGRALAGMHIAGAGFALTRRNDLGLEGWQRLAKDCLAQADEVMPGLGHGIETEIDHLAACWPDDLPAGVIHADLFCDNVFFENGRLTGLIDFYFACNDFLAYDVAVCLNAWCFENEREFNVTKARSLLAAYRQVRPFETAELDALPLLARGAALRFLLTRLYDWLHPVDGALVTPKDPLEFWRKLSFHREVKSPAAYGLT